MLFQNDETNKLISVESNQAQRSGFLLTTMELLMMARIDVHWTTERGDEINLCGVILHGPDVW